VDQLKSGLAQAKAMKLPELFSIETEYHLAGVETELAFVGRLISRIRKDGCGFLKEWKKSNAERILKEEGSRAMIASQDKGYKGLGMEGRIASWYTKNTARDMVEFRRLADHFSREIPTGGHVLEVAPGPGYLSIELAKRGQYEITGLDISQSFVKIARENARRESVRVNFEHGNASDMPFPAESFDLILCRAAFKNFSRPVEAINEMHRVLRPGGRAVIMDLRKDASSQDIDAYVRNVGWGWKDALINKAIFRYLLIPRAYSKEQLIRMTESSLFRETEIIESGIGFEITLKK
jgi:ubiquinone/menaquinone biosynthesis C-methylase UbiE